MRIRHFNKKNEWWEQGDYVTPLETEGEIVVVVDPSKSNTAVLVGSVYGDVYDIIEMSGNDKQFYKTTGDTTVFCLEMYEYLKARLRGSRVISMHAEEALTKKGKKGEKFKIENHITNKVLTEVRASFTRLALVLTKVKLDEINNWSWKKAVLPEGYRGQHEKGSVRYWPQVDPFWYGYSDDVTDVYSIYQYLVRGKFKTMKLECNKAEPEKIKYSMAIVDKTSVNPERFNEFKFNPKFTLIQNAIYYANRKNKAGYAVLTKDSISIENIYQYGVRLTAESVLCLIVVPERR